jgi:GTPase
MTFTVAILGRPNVGKSTLFNRLIGKRLALVDDRPGVTRDRREGDGRIADLKFRLIDTAGLEDVHDSSLESRMREQTERALADADVAIFLIDARAGVTPVDAHFAGWLRRQPVPIIVAANKCEGRAGESGLLEAFSLGLGEPVPLSAEHGEGLGELYDALLPVAEAKQADAWAETADLFVDTGEEKDDAVIAARPLQLAIVGRPNVGKSTLLNRLIGEDRMLTGPEAGITRDAIAVAWSWKGKDIRLIDTAGMRRKARVTDKIESLSVGDTLRAVRFAQVVVLVIDAAQPMERQDLNIARTVIDEGRALIIAVNKWDTVADRREALGQVRDRLETSLPQVRGVPVVTLSALTGKGLERLLPAAMEIFETWNVRLTTSALNRWLESTTEAHPPPMGKGGRRIRIRYITQAKTRPPTFVLFSSRAHELPESYLRYLTNALRDDFGLDGVPIRLLARRGKNPYA